MSKKKLIIKEMENIVYQSGRIKVCKELNNEMFFEIENELTTDLSEAIAMYINLNIKDTKFLDIEFKINTNNISPDKTLYWLSGGDKEWLSKNHYSKSWSEVYLEYQKEFGTMIIYIIKNSKTLNDVRNQFLSKMNLLTLYEFALNNGYIKK